MQFGICTSLDNAPAAQAGGWDFIEENVQVLLKGQTPDSEWSGLEKVKACPLPVLAANCLVPGSLKIVGPQADLVKLRDYMAVVLRRARLVGMKVLVFGSGGARNVPDGCDRETARRQIVEFMKMCCPLAAEQGITLVAEHLNTKECNIINSVAEAMTYVKAVDHPNFQCLVDSYHFYTEGEPLDSLREAMPWIKHVHLADKDGRVAPGESGTMDYRPFFRILKEGGYRGLMSIEPIGFKDIAGASPRILAFLKKQWEEA